MSLLAGNEGGPRIQSALHFLGPGAERAHDLLDMLDSIELELQLVDLSYDIVAFRNLRIGGIDQVALRIINIRKWGVGLLREVDDLLFYVLQDDVKVSSERAEAICVEEERSITSRVHVGSHRL